jgi:anti-sigma factor RsiW
MRDKETTLSSSCAKAKELVAYLYHEASEREAKEFESHMQACASCEAELAAFGHVRSSIADWRNQALGSVEFRASADRVTPATELRKASPPRRASAMTALREFFALSPVWLRAATALASLAICALVVWAAVRTLEAPRVVVLEKVVEKGPTQAEVDALVDKRVREELAARGNQQEATSKEVIVPVNEQRPSTIAQSGQGRSAARRALLAPGRKPAQVSTQEYEELARDLQLVPTRDEDDLPRLIDLMDEAN